MRRTDCEGEALVSGIRRRDFVILLGGGTAAWPLAAAAQQPAVPVIGFLSNLSRERGDYRLVAFREGLRETGFVEGQNVAIEYRWAEGRNDRLPMLAAELARHPVRVMVTAGGTPAALAAKAATTTIPIVFGVAVDPVQVGLVASLNRPGGNLTGVTNLNAEVGPKRLELLHEVLPQATVFSLLTDPSNAPLAGPFSHELLEAARTLGVELHVLHASTERDFAAAFASMARLRAAGLILAPASFFVDHSEQLAALAVRHAVPAIFQYRSFTAAGGLLSYGSSEAAYYRPVGIYVGRILNGEKPADLPVQQSTKVELIVNLKAAKALRLTIPLSLLGRADEVIE
jgi:putative ABC transport system substrate-binding protein